MRAGSPSSYSTDYADLAYAIAYWRRRSTTRAGATSARNANATSDAYPWINDKAQAPIEKELIEAFKAEVLKGAFGLIWLLTWKNLHPSVSSSEGIFQILEWASVCLNSLLRLGVPNVNSWSLLGMSSIFSTSNVTVTTRRLLRGLGEHQDESVCSSHLVRRKQLGFGWRAGRGLGIFSPDSTDYRDLTYAIAYWSRRSTGGARAKNI